MRLRHRSAAFGAALAAMALLSACRNGPVAAGDAAQDAGAALARETAALFQTDSLTYTLLAGSDGYSGEIGVRFTNRTGGTVYFVNCNGATSVSLEKRVDGEWQEVWLPALPECLSPPITVPPGRTYATRIHVFGGYPGTNAGPQFAVTDVAGVYRVVWHAALRSYQTRLPFGEPLPLAHRVSNRFTVRVQPR
jgi:hypothetical protein